MKHDSCVYPSDTPPEKVHHVVTLVHGTWAPNAPWTGQESDLCAELRRKLDPGVVFTRFSWSGKNTHPARRDAAIELRELLIQQIEKYPKTAKHYIIGHSHGGSVALYSMQDVEGAAHPLAGKELRKRIDGIICLSTPFLTARQRELGDDKIGQFVGGLIALMFIAMFCATRIAWVAALPDWALYGGMFLFFLVVISPLAMLAIKYKEKWPKLMRELALPEMPPEKLLIMRSPADEASAGMAFAQFLCQISVLAYRRILCGVDRFQLAASQWSGRRWKPALLFVVAIAFVPVGVFFALELQKQGLPIGTNVMVVGMLLCVFIAFEALFLFFKKLEMVMFPFRMLTGLILWPLVLGLIALMVIPFGWEMAKAAILLDVTAEATPPGQWEIRQMEPPPRPKVNPDTLTLMHSAIYGNPQAIQQLCEWISPQEGAGKM